MKSFLSIVIFLILIASFFIDQSIAQIHTPENIQLALKKNTRSTDGAPGPEYWQNRADYAIDVSIDTKTLKVSGQETITYYNNSPDTLFHFLLLLLPDLYKKGNPRDFIVASSDEHNGIVLSGMEVNGKKIDASRNSKALFYQETYAWIIPDQPFNPGSANTISVSWFYTLNAGSHMRTGQIDESSYFLAYFYPRIGVYDDIEGWNPFIYTGVGEFYNDFGDFDVNIAVPGDFVVWATGELQNPEDLLNQDVLLRYKKAHQTSEVITIVDESDIKNKSITTSQAENTWNFKADNVMDFAFALSDHYLWQANTLDLGREGKKVFVSTAFPANSPDFREVIHIAQKSINYMVNELPGLPFPYPCITVFNGLDEMEYPMMVNDLSFEDLESTFKLTAHEICHSYFPFMTGCNERKYAWMDEGLTSFFEYNMIRDLINSNIVSIYFLDYYLEIRGTEKDIPLITQSDLIRPPDYYAISYPKAASMYSEIMNELGREKFKEVLAVFISRWEGKHPTGYDLINTFLDVGGRNLQNILIPWLFEYGYVDIGITGLTQNNGKTHVTVNNSGNYPVGFNLILTYTDHTKEMLTFKPSIWNGNNKQIEIPIDKLKEIASLQIKQDIPTDIYPENNLYINKKQ